MGRISGRLSKGEPRGIGRFVSWFALVVYRHHHLLIHATVFPMSSSELSGALDPSAISHNPYYVPYQQPQPLQNPNGYYYHTQPLQAQQEPPPQHEQGYLPQQQVYGQQLYPVEQPYAYQPCVTKPFTRSSSLTIDGTGTH